MQSRLVSSILCLGPLAAIRRHQALVILVLFPPLIRWPHPLALRLIFPLWAQGCHFSAGLTVFKAHRTPPPSAGACSDGDPPTPTANLGKAGDCSGEEVRKPVHLRCHCPH